MNRGSGRRSWMWLLLAAVAAVGVAVGAVIAAGQVGGERQRAADEQPSTGTGAGPAAARPPQSSPLPTTAPNVPHRFYVLVQRLPASSPDDAAGNLAARARAKGFPATVINSHGDLPPNTSVFWIAVLSGKFPNRQEAEAQVTRLRQAGFPEAEVLDVACDDLAGNPIPVQAC